MKTKIAVLFAAFGYMWNSATATPNDGCVAWQCQAGLGNNTQGADRTCAAVNESVFVTEECEPDTFLCQTGVTVTDDVKCAETDPLPWRQRLVGNDTCTHANQCLSGTCVNETATCTSLLNIGDACANEEGITGDEKCPSGHFCGRATPEATEDTCTPVIANGGACSGALRCAFGNACVNNTCTTLGSLKDGTWFFIQDDNLFPAGVGAEVLMYRVCENFWGVDTGNRTEDPALPIYECTPGYQREFSEDARPDATEPCKYNLTVPTNGTVLEIEENAECGFNKDTSFYCPARRGADQFATENRLDRATWKDAPATCHIRTSIQYCKDIEGNTVRSLAFRNALRTEWITTGNQWSLVANNDRCVGNSIAQTRGYWRLVDSSYSAILSYFGLIAGLFVLTFVY